MLVVVAVVGDDRIGVGVPLADLFEAGTLPVNYDSHCCRNLGFPVTGHFCGEVPAQPAG
jgi:hypothetical protein